MKNKDEMVLVSESAKKYEIIAAKLAYARVIGEHISFPRAFNAPKFKSISEVEDWKQGHIYPDELRTYSYTARLERIAKLPQISIKDEELGYLEHFLLIGDMPAVAIDGCPSQKPAVLNRKWETASLFIRLDEKVEKGAKFTKLAEDYTKMMPEQVRNEYGIVKPSKLRKAHSRGKVKVNYPKKFY